MKRTEFQADEHGNLNLTLFLTGTLNSKAFEWFGQKCAKCGLENAPKKKYVVHHRHYRTLGHESPEDVVMLCKACHADLHARAKTFQLTEADLPLVDPEWADKLRGR